MTTYLVAWAVLLKAKLFAALVPFLIPLDGAGIDYNSNDVSPKVKTMRTAIVSNVLYAFSGAFFLVAVLGVFRLATGNKHRDGVQMLLGGLLGGLVCLMPTEAGAWFFGIIKDMTGI